jgi:hypothetical protein
MFCLLWSTIVYSEDDVEEGGIKIKEKNLFMKMAIFLYILFLFQITTFGCWRVC